MSSAATRSGAWPSRRSRSREGHDLGLVVRRERAEQLLAVGAPEGSHDADVHAGTSCHALGFLARFSAFVGHRHGPARALGTRVDRVLTSDLDLPHWHSPPVSASAPGSGSTPATARAARTRSPVHFDSPHRGGAHRVGFRTAGSRARIVVRSVEGRADSRVRPRHPGQPQRRGHRRARGPGRRSGPLGRPTAKSASRSTSRIGNRVLYQRGPREPADQAQRWGETPHPLRPRHPRRHRLDAAAPLPSTTPRDSAPPARCRRGACAAGRPQDVPTTKDSNEQSNSSSTTPPASRSSTASTRSPNTIKVTLGPKGRNMESSTRNQPLTDDHERRCDDRPRDRARGLSSRTSAAQLAKEVSARKTNNDSPVDGTTTATVLAPAIVRERALRDYIAAPASHGASSTASTGPSRPSPRSCCAPRTTSSPRNRSPRSPPLSAPDRRSAQRWPRSIRQVAGTSVVTVECVRHRVDRRRPRRGRPVFQRLRQPLLRLQTRAPSRPSS